MKTMFTKYLEIRLCHYARTVNNKAHFNKVKSDLVKQILFMGQHLVIRQNIYYVIIIDSIKCDKITNFCNYLSITNLQIIVNCHTIYNTNMDCYCYIETILVLLLTPLCLI